ncbi:enoyl-CoA hydratase-related protein [Burkholderia glumae]
MNSHVAVALSSGGVADVRLDRPERLDALVDASFEDRVATADRLGRNLNVRAVVLHGAGRAFCTGLDLSSFAGSSDTPTGRDLLATCTYGIANRYLQAVMVWPNFPVPVIAAVHGVAFGGGLQFALGAEVRLVGPDARFNVMEIKWGIVPDMAGFVLMSQVIRADVMRELVYTGRVVSGEQAVVLGLATRVTDAPLHEAAVWHLKSRNAASRRYPAQNA